MTFITIQNQNTERNRLSVHVTKIPLSYMCLLRRQLSALYWAYRLRRVLLKAAPAALATINDTYCYGPRVSFFGAHEDK